MTCEVRLCGPPAIVVNGQPVANVRHKTMALIAYLVAEGGPKSRDTLATLLWPSSGQASARGNLRTVLHDARRLLPSNMIDSGIETLELLPCAETSVDLWKIKEALKALRENDSAVWLLSQVAALFRGDFLEGFTLGDCSDFDFWQLQTSEGLRHQHALVLSRLVVARLDAGALSEAVDDVVRLIALDPLEEASHRLAIAAYALAGRWAMALEQFDECRRILREELDTEPALETLHLAEEVRRRASHLYRSGTQPTSARHGKIQPPVPATAFFGRERELALLTKLLVGGSRLVTIVGPAGVGKTRLALEAARTNESSFPDGVAFGELTATRAPDDVLRILEAAVGVQQRIARGGKTAAAVAEHLTGRHALVLLDNFEHVIAAAPEIARVITSSQTVQFLVTSREPLHVSGETILRLSPLEVPKEGPERELYHNPAVNLFVDRARNQFPELEDELSDLESVRSVCAVLDGLPLALELAVPLLHVYSLQELPCRVASPLGYLDRGGRDLPERHRSLEQAIDWSYSLLESEEREILVQLSAFADGFDIAAAESVCVPTKAGGFRSSFAGLLDKSLVQILAEEPVRRFRLLESTREYVAGQEGAAEAGKMVRQRHAEHYSCLALEAEAELHGPQQMQWLEKLDAAHPNLLEALGFLFTEGSYLRGLQSTTALEWYWYRRGQYRLGVEQIQKFLDCTVDLVAPVRARALHAAGWFTFLLGDWRAGHYLYAQSLYLSRQVDDPVSEQLALSDLGVAERWLGDVENGSRYARAGVDVAREHGDSHSLARALVWAYATTGGRFVDTYPLAELREALSLAERTGDLWLVAHAHNGLGDLHCTHGHDEKAMAHYSLALSGFEKLGDRYLAAWTLEGMGRVEAHRGRVKSALARTFEALELFDALGDDLNVGLMMARVVALLEEKVQDSPRAVLAGAAAGLVNARSGEDLARTPQVDEAMRCIVDIETGFPTEWHCGRALSRATAVRKTRSLVEESGLA